MNENKTTYDVFLSLRDELVDYAAALLKSRDDAQDLVQDLYVKLWARKDELSEVEKPRAFCMTIIRNRCLDILESHENRQKSQMPSEIEDEHSIEEQMAAKERLAAALAQIKRLPEGQQTVLAKRVVEDMSYEQISAQTGLSEQNLRTQMSLARKTLRQRLAWTFAVLAVAMAVGVGVLFHKPQPLEDTYSDPLLAYAQVEKTFGFISTKVDKGMQVARDAELKLERVDEVLKNINN